MAMLYNLNLGDYTVETVLLPGANGPEQGYRITVYGDHFPLRAAQPVLRVGGMAAELVKVAADQKSIRGYLRHLPPNGAPISVSYDEQMAGEVKTPFNRKRIQPLPKDCC